MQSFRQSVHQLLEDQIARLGLQAHYPVQKAEKSHYVAQFKHRRCALVAGDDIPGLLPTSGKGSPSAISK